MVHIRNLLGFYRFSYRNWKLLGVWAIQILNIFRFLRQEMYSVLTGKPKLLLAPAWVDAPIYVAMESVWDTLNVALSWTRRLLALMLKMADRPKGLLASSAAWNWDLQMNMAVAAKFQTSHEHTETAAASFAPHKANLLFSKESTLITETTCSLCLIPNSNFCSNSIRFFFDSELLDCTLITHFHLALTRVFHYSDNISRYGLPVNARCKWGLCVAMVSG